MSNTRPSPHAHEDYSQTRSVVPLYLVSILNYSLTVSL